MSADIDDTADFGNPFQKKETTTSHDNILTKKRPTDATITTDNILKGKIKRDTETTIEKNDNSD